MSTMEHITLFLTANTILSSGDKLEINIEKLIEKAVKLEEKEKKELKQ